MLHILGMGSIGRLIGHALRRQAVEVTFLVRPVTLDRYSSDWQLNVIDPKSKTLSSGYTFESSVPGHHAKSISTLLVCTKAYSAAQAIETLRSRITQETHIVLLNNGIGVEQELFQVFQQDGVYPLISHGLISHGAYSIDDTNLRHAGFGTFVLATHHMGKPDSAIASLVKQLVDLKAEHVTIEEFRIKQLLKLLVNVCINPITAINGDLNGSVSTYPALLEALVSESLAVLRKAFPSIKLSEEDALRTIYTVVEATKNNTSSMLQDVKASRMTEIDYINGAFTKLGRQHQRPTPFNAKLVELIESISITEAADRKLSAKHDLQLLSEQAAAM